MGQTALGTRSWWQRTCSLVGANSYDLLRLFVSFALLSAAGLKAYELANEYIFPASVWDSRPFLILLVLIELGLGLWLLFALYAEWSRLAALALFLEFLVFSLVQGLVGYKSCGCLGKLEISPWLTLVFDAIVVCALLALQPKQSGGPKLSSARLRLFALMMVYGLVAAPAVTNMILYFPRAPMWPLRVDKPLRAQLPIDLKRPSTEEILSPMRQATGLNLTIDAALESLAPDYGRIGPTRLTVWQLMEGIAEHQRVPARWDKVENGYHLRSVAFVGSRLTPWFISAALGAAILLGTRVWVASGKQKRAP